MEVDCTMYRFEVYLKNGKRHKAYYDLDKPNVIQLMKMEFAADDSYLDGAYCVTSNDEIFRALQTNGFTVSRPMKGRVDYCVRLPEEMAVQVNNAAAAEGMHEATVIRQAVAFWIENGCPL